MEEVYLWQIVAIVLHINKVMGCIHCVTVSLQEIIYDIYEASYVIFWVVRSSDLDIAGDYVAES